MNRESLMSSFSIGVAGLVVGVLGVIGPIAWDFYKTKSELEVRAVDRTILIGRSAKVDGLTIAYKGENLNQLSKTIISVTNTGRTPILEKDVVSPLTIKFDKATQIVDARLEKATPPESQASAVYLRTENSVLISAPLMNPGDALQLSVLAKTEEFNFDASARIAGLSSVTVIKDGLSRQASRGFSWLAIPVGGLSILLTLVSIVGFSQVSPELKSKRLLREDKFKIPFLADKEQTLLWIESAFSFASSDQRAIFKRLVNNLPESENFSIVHQNQLMQGIDNLLYSMLPNLPMSTGLFLIGCVGIWYTFTNLLPA